MGQSHAPGREFPASMRALQADHPLSQEGALRQPLTSPCWPGALYCGRTHGPETPSSRAVPLGL